MNVLRLLPMAAVFVSFSAAAQTATCPELPASSGMSWDVQDGPGFTYCKAVRNDDGSQAFAVMLRAESDFRGRRGLREGDAVVIDGHRVYWYRGEVQNALVRETLVELDRDSTAHIVLRASSEDQLAETQQVAEALRFGDLRVGSY
jgi:hypothetical protein